MVKIKDIADYLENLAPLPLQEDYDNSGLLTGDRDTQVTGILVSLDCTEEIIREAIDKNCNMVVAHHPVIFKGLKSLTGKNYVERTVIDAIKNNIAIYAIHTNLDNVQHGVSKKIADILGLEKTRVLNPLKNLKKIVTYIPIENTKKVLKALYQAGAGEIGNYRECSFSVEGTGTFLPGEESNPAVGSRNKPEKVNENRVEIILPAYKQEAILQALKNAHPYEEVAYYLSGLENSNQDAGAGIVGYVKPIEPLEFLKKIKGKMKLSCIRHTGLPDKKIEKVAVCGGSGSFLLNRAIAEGADIFITSDFKYHEFFDADNRIIIADIGHYESEVFTKELIRDYLCNNFTTFAVNLSESNTNPIRYLT